MALGKIVLKEGEWWIRWKHKNVVNEVFFSRPSQTKGECVGVNVDDLSLTNMEVVEQGKTTPRSLCDVSIVKDREERDTLGEREIVGSCVKQRKDNVESSCVKSVKPRSSNGKWVRSF